MASFTWQELSVDDQLDWIFFAFLFRKVAPFLSVIFMTSEDLPSLWVEENTDHSTVEESVRAQRFVAFYNLR